MRQPEHGPGSVAHPAHPPSSIDDYECALCTDLLYEPVVAPCGHVFCRYACVQVRFCARARYMRVRAQGLHGILYQCSPWWAGASCPEHAAPQPSPFCFESTPGCTLFLLGEAGL